MPVAGMESTLAGATTSLAPSPSFLSSGSCLGSCPSKLPLHTLVWQTRLITTATLNPQRIIGYTQCKWPPVRTTPFAWALRVTTRKSTRMLHRQDDASTHIQLTLGTTAPSATDVMLYRRRQIPRPLPPSSILGDELYCTVLTATMAVASDLQSRTSLRLPRVDERHICSEPCAAIRLDDACTNDASPG
nr:hypothetical protein CFP56_32383 [Quercus suber]